jgi:NitT/TauT family transport system permease protein/putative hydroxymethylpyrimidine transport system permease protein
MLAALLLLAFFGAWQAYCDLGDVDALVLPSPTDVATALWDDRSLLADQLAVTAREMAIGLVVALVVAVVFAIAMHRFDPVRRAVYPLAIASQTIPIPGIAPLLVFWWGFGVLPKIFVIALICFFPMLVPVLDRLRGVDPGLTKLMQTFGATRWQRLRLVEGPAALPGLFTGLKLAVAVAAIAALLAEGTGVTSADGGLGVLITQSQGQLETARAFAAIVLLSLLSLALFGLVAVLERLTVPWALRKDPTP